VLPILASYIVWLPAVLGLGATVLAPFKKHTPQNDPAQLFLISIAGLALLATIANLLNFVAPVVPPVALFVLIFGWLAFVRQWRVVASAVSGPWPTAWPLLLSAVACALCYTAYVARMTPIHYDTGLYHLQAIKWIAESQLPLGLANLHSRFGYNSSLFSAAAMIEIPPLIGKGAFVINGLCYSVYGIVSILSISRVARGSTKASDIYLGLNSIVWALLARSSQIGSPEPDLPATIIGMVSVYLSLRAVEGRTHRRYYVYAGFALAFVAITVKLSAIPLLLAPTVVLALFLRYDSPRRTGWLLEVWRALPALAAMGALLIGPWLFRGVLLSGYLLYPSTIGRLGFLSWAVPISGADSERQWIMSWARRPGLAPDVVLANWDWLPLWANSISGNSTVRLSATMLVSGVLLCAVARVVARGPGSRWTLAIPSLTPLAGLAYWFMLAPDPRFGQAFIWSGGLLVLSIGLASVAQIGKLGTHPSRSTLGVSSALILMFVFASLIVARGFFPVEKATLVSWPSLQRVEVMENVTKDGVTITSPAKGDQCWDSRLPCTPYFTPDIKVDIKVPYDGNGKLRGFSSGGQD